MKLAKSLKAGGSPLMIVAEFLLWEVGMVEQLGRSVDRVPRSADMRSHHYEPQGASQAPQSTISPVRR